MPLFLAALASAAPAFSAERRYSVTDFDRLIVEGPFIVRLAPGRTSSAVAEGVPSALETLSVDTQGQTLRIRRNRSAWGGYPGEAAGVVTVLLFTRNLRSARLIGPGRLEVENMRGMDMEFVVEGAGQLQASGITADRVSIGLSGSGRMEIGGTAEAVSINAQGSGTVDAGSLAAENMKIMAATTGTVIASASETAEVDANGVGEVRVIGQPDCTVRGLGAGLVRCGSGLR